MALLLLTLAAAAVTVASSSSAVSELAVEEAALEALAAPNFRLSSLEAAEVERLVHKGWHEAVRALIALGHRGTEEETQRVATQVRQAVKSERNRLDDLTRALDRNYGKAVDVSPASQWAQNSTHVFLAVKFAQRWNAPGALEVENETVDISECCLNFTAYGEHSFIRRRYHLSFELFRRLQPKLSSWSLASVGRMSVTLCKAKAANWPRLLASSTAAPKNLGIWRDMKEKWQGELDRFPPLVDTSITAGLAGANATDSVKGTASAAPVASAAQSTKKQPKPRSGRGKSSKAAEEEEEEALDREVESLAECAKASYAGSPVAELCLPAWAEVVESPRVRHRRWLVQLYSSEGRGDAEAMKTLMPVWKRLADVFPSMVPGGRVGAVDCRTERELCKQLGIAPGSNADAQLPQIRRFLGVGGRGDVWPGSTAASIEELAEFGGGKQEL